MNAGRFDRKGIMNAVRIGPVVVDMGTQGDNEGRNNDDIGDVADGNDNEKKVLFCERGANFQELEISTRDELNVRREVCNHNEAMCQWVSMKKFIHCLVWAYEGFVHRH